MSWIIPLSTNTEFSLLAGQNMYVARNINIFTTYDAVMAINANSQILVDGSIISGSFRAIYIGNRADWISNNTITISETGYVRSMDADAIESIGYNNEINNAGTIIGRTAGIVIEGSYVDAVTAGHLNINNSGKITAEQVAIDSDYLLSTQKIFINNTGLISGGTSAFEASSTQAAIDTITNSGTMKGNVLLGAGNDYFDGRKGHIIGTVYGGAGTDKLYGGTENNILKGEAGADTLYGGYGKDTLSGGSDADVFVFKSVADSKVSTSGRDLVTDFAHGTDTLDLGAIDANSSKSGNQAFHFIGSQPFHKSAGELHFQKTSSDTIVSGDTNGDGKADFAITLHGLISLTSSDFVL